MFPSLVSTKYHLPRPSTYKAKEVLRRFLMFSLLSPAVCNSLFHSFTLSKCQYYSENANGDESVNGSGRSLPLNIFPLLINWEQEKELSWGNEKDVCVQVGGEEGQREKKWQNPKQAPPGEEHEAGLKPMTWRSWLQPKSTRPGAPVKTILSPKNSFLFL